MDTMSKIVEQVTSNLGSLTNVREHDAESKENFAELCGLTSVAASGSYAAMVAVHEDLPDIVVKVVPEYDKYLCFAEDMLAGLLEEEFFPKVYSITDLGTHSLVVVERIAEELDGCNDEDNDIVDAIASKTCDYCFAEDSTEIPEDTMAGQIAHMAKRHNALNDAHFGNFMRRKDGTVVCIDPLWCGWHEEVEPAYPLYSL